MIGGYDRRRKEFLFPPVIHYNRLLWLDGHRRPHCKGIINNDMARLLVFSMCPYLTTMLLALFWKPGKAQKAETIRCASATMGADNVGCS